MIHNIVCLVLAMAATATATEPSVIDCNEFDYSDNSGVRMLRDDQNCHMYYGCDKIAHAGGNDVLHEYHRSCDEKFWSQAELRCVENMPADCTYGQNVNVSSAADMGPSAVVNWASIGGDGVDVAIPIAAADEPIAQPAAVEDGEATAQSPTKASGVELCPYKPVADRPDQFESKTVEGAIYNCPLGLVFDFESFPCGCVRDENPEPDVFCPYKPVDGSPEKFESKTAAGAIYTCPSDQVFDFAFFPCGCFPKGATMPITP